MKLLSIFGTRPEAIKMAPLLMALRDEEELESVVCVTAQHRGMLDQVLDVFEVVPDYDLDLMLDSQGLADVTGRVLAGVGRVIEDESPQLVLVHGDTNTTMSAALAAYYGRVDVGHVEAGLRTGDRYAPWPEEMNRRIADVLATIHFAPTEAARRNLLREGVDPQAIHVTGNTVVDALVWTRDRIRKHPRLSDGLAQRFSYLSPDRRLVLVTGHRRESFGGGFRRICEALTKLAARGDAEILYPVHLNPQVREPVEELLGGREHIHLIPPVDYATFVYLMDRSHLILTDSGGVQEEAPSLGKPVLVMRETTERPEGLDAGTARLVGTSPERIVSAASELLDDPDSYEAMARAHNPYGDGCAAQRMVEILKTRNATEV